MARISRVAALLMFAAGIAGAADINSSDFSAKDLFQLSKVWTVELTFTSAQWKAMAPRFDGPQGPGFLLGPDGGHNGFMAARGLVFNWAHADLTIDGRHFADIGVRDKGNGTYMEGSERGKISMKLHLSKYVKGQKLANMSTFNLANNITDAGWMNEELAYRLFRDAGVPAPRSSYARVYITVTGQSPRRYVGLYSLIEDVDEHFIQDRFGSKTGALLKPVPPSLFAYQGDDWAAYNQTYDPKTELTAAQKSRIIEFCKVVTSASDKEFAARVGDYIDLDNFARFLAVDVWLSDLDGILNVGQNYYVYLDPATNKFSFTAWDHDHSFGQMGRASNADTENFSILHPWSNRNRFIGRMFAVPAFRDLYLAHMRDFAATIFQPARIFRQVDELAPAIRSAIADESDNAVRRFDQVTADPSPGRANMFGETLKSFVRARTPLVLDQLNGKSQGARYDSDMR
jgi:spore coat protein CotH